MLGSPAPTRTVLFFRRGMVNKEFSLKYNELEANLLILKIYLTENRKPETENGINGLAEDDSLW